MVYAMFVTIESNNVYPSGFRGESWNIILPLVKMSIIEMYKLALSFLQKGFVI